jgi:hypothetical protein
MYCRRRVYVRTFLKSKTVLIISSWFWLFFYSDWMNCAHCVHRDIIVDLKIGHPRNYCFVHFLAIIRLWKRHISINRYKTRTNIVDIKQYYTTKPQNALYLKWVEIKFSVENIVESNWIEFINWHSLKWAFQWQFTWILEEIMSYRLYIFTTILSK